MWDSLPGQKGQLSVAVGTAPAGLTSTQWPRVGSFLNSLMPDSTIGKGLPQVKVHGGLPRMLASRQEDSNERASGHRLFEPYVRSLQSGEGVSFVSGGRIRGHQCPGGCRVTREADQAHGANVHSGHRR